MAWPNHKGIDLRVALVGNQTHTLNLAKPDDSPVHVGHQYSVVWFKRHPFKSKYDLMRFRPITQQWQLVGDGIGIPGMRMPYGYWSFLFNDPDFGFFCCQHGAPPNRQYCNELSGYIPASMTDITAADLDRTCQ